MITFLLYLLLAVFIGLLYHGIHRKVIARIQTRPGPPIWQEFLHTLKFSFKQTWIPKTASQLMFVAIVVIMIAIWVGGLYVLLSGGSLLSLLFRGAGSTAVVGTLTSVIAALLALVSALKVLLSGTSLSQTVPWTVPGGEFSLLLDPLAAFFVLPIAVLSLFCAVYAGPYMSHDGPSRSTGSHWFFFNVMVAAMLLVVTAANAVLFLAAWEIMTLSSFFLVAWDLSLIHI